MVAIRATDNFRHGIDGSLGRSFREFVSVDPNGVGGCVARKLSALRERSLSEAGRYHSCEGSSRKHVVLLCPDVLRNLVQNDAGCGSTGWVRGESAVDSGAPVHHLGAASLGDKNKIPGG